MNVARKKKEREENKVRSLAGMKRQDGESDGEEDKEWFRKEVGEEPDPGVCTHVCVHSNHVVCVIV